MSETVRIEGKRGMEGGASQEDETISGEQARRKRGELFGMDLHNCQRPQLLQNDDGTFLALRGSYPPQVPVIAIFA